MYIKLQNNIINLDLIKKVTEVNAYHVLRLDYEKGNKAYYHEIESAEREAQLLSQTTNGNDMQREYVVAYGFEIYYLNERFPEKVITGTSRRDAGKYLQSFMQLVNNNQPVIHEVNI